MGSKNLLWVGLIAYGGGAALLAFVEDWIVPVESEGVRLAGIAVGGLLLAVGHFVATFAYHSRSRGETAFEEYDSLDGRQQRVRYRYQWVGRHFLESALFAVWLYMLVFRELLFHPVMIAVLGILILNFVIMHVSREWFKRTL